MAKKKHTKKAKVKNIVLSEDDMIRTFTHLSKLRVSENRRDWIEHKMYELRQRATNGERNVMGCLKSIGAEFIPQAPFVLDDNIYFADFYFPKQRIIVEVDGKSHLSSEKMQSDGERDKVFASYMIKTYRITNDKALDNKFVMDFLSNLGIKTKSRVYKTTNN